MSVLDKQLSSQHKGSAKTRQIDGIIQQKALIGGTVAIGKFPIDPQTYILVAETGIEAAAVLSGDEVVFTATANDIRIGKVAATADGITEGTKVIPSYHTTVGTKIVMPGSIFSFILGELDTYDYTKLQCIICKFNTSLSNSVFTDKIVLDNNVYDVKSTISLSLVNKNAENKSIDLGISNDTDTPYVVRFFTYKEID